MPRVARMYHEEGLPQREIAVRLSVLQSRVSRMLRRAAEAGIGLTVVVAPPEVHADLEDALRAANGLRDAVVVDDASLPALGAAAAAYLDATVAAGDRIGIASWSATLMAAADAMSAPVASRASEVTQLRDADVTVSKIPPSPSLREARLLATGVGAIGDPAVQFRATGLTARLAELTGARAVPLPAPGLLRSVALPLRIGVPGGAQKYPAVRAVLRGGWINVLITDAASAQRLAEERP